MLLEGERWCRAAGGSIDVDGQQHQDCSFCCMITEWFGWEGTFKDHLVQPPCHWQGHLPLGQVVQSPVQPGLEHFQG